MNLKLFRIPCIVLLVVLLCSCLCFASDIESPTDLNSDDISSDVSDTPGIRDDLKQIIDIIKETQETGKIEVEPYENVELTQLRISSSDTSGLHSIVLSLIGDYNPIVKDYTYQSSQGYTTHSIEIEPDYSWMFSAGIFIVVLYCAFRIFGMIFNR